jgi:hypothetical protein
MLKLNYCAPCLTGRLGWNGKAFVTKSSYTRGKIKFSKNVRRKFEKKLKSVNWKHTMSKRHYILFTHLRNFVFPQKLIVTLISFLGTGQLVDVLTTVNCSLTQPSFLFRVCPFANFQSSIMLWIGYVKCLIHISVEKNNIFLRLSWTSLNQSIRIPEIVFKLDHLRLPLTFHANTNSLIIN